MIGLRIIEVEIERGVREEIQKEIQRIEREYEKGLDDLIKGLDELNRHLDELEELEELVEMYM